MRYWTIEAPTEPGWYWVSMGGNVEVVEVARCFEDGPLMFFCAHDEDTCGWKMEQADEWWSERLEPPTDSKEEL